MKRKLFTTKNKKNSFYLDDLQQITQTDNEIHVTLKSGNRCRIDEMDRYKLIDLLSLEIVLYTNTLLEWFLNEYMELKGLDSGKFVVNIINEKVLPKYHILINGHMINSVSVKDDIQETIIFKSDDGKTYQLHAFKSLVIAAIYIKD